MFSAGFAFRVGYVHTMILDVESVSKNEFNYASHSVELEICCVVHIVKYVTVFFFSTTDFKSANWHVTFLTWIPCRTAEMQLYLYSSRLKSARVPRQEKSDVWTYPYRAGLHCMITLCAYILTKYRHYYEIESNSVCNFAFTVKFQ